MGRGKLKIPSKRIPLNYERFDPHPLDDIDVLLLLSLVKNPTWAMREHSKQIGYSSAMLTLRMKNPTFKVELDKRRDIALNGLAALEPKALTRLEEALDITMDNLNQATAVRVDVSKFIMQPYVNKSRITVKHEGDLSNIPPEEIKSLLDEMSKESNGKGE